MCDFLIKNVEYAMQPQKCCDKKYENIVIIIITPTTRRIDPDLGHHILITIYEILTNGMEFHLAVTIKFPPLIKSQLTNFLRVILKLF